MDADEMLPSVKGWRSAGLSQMDIVIMVLRRNMPGVSQRLLAEILDIKQPAIARRVRTLERFGFLKERKEVVEYEGKIREQEIPVRRQAVAEIGA
ncbi:MAG: MarR family transcriptional regulator [Candidatus Aenigmatarchaeota archaeon]|nr:MAG: MarR family transcriptional regulator [Candidatus Aenigmarchaeota archaeon]